MRRRDFIVAISGAAAAWPLAARAQQPIPVIGFLHSGSAEARRGQLTSFLGGLKETGFTEGHNVKLEYRWAAGNYDQLPALADDLVQREVSVIAALGGVFVGLVAKRATSMIPIVFIGTNDPVKLGLVTSLNQQAETLQAWYCLPLNFSASD